MNKEIREKITEIIENGFYKSTPSVKMADEILSYLDPYVRIVKEIELLERNPKYNLDDRDDVWRSIGYAEAQQDMLKWHNESLERLI